MHRTLALSTLRAATLALCVSLAAHAGADAPNAEAAQALFDEGKALLAAGRASDACPKFEESQRLDPALGTLLNLADCYERQGRLGSAWATFRAAFAQARAGGHADAARVAEQRGQTLAARLPKIVIDVRALERTPALSIQQNGVPVPREDWGQPLPTEPGTHHFLASAPGRRSWVGTLVVSEAPGTTHIEVPELAPAPAPAPGEAGEGTAGANAWSAEPRAGRWSTQHTAAVLAAGAGVAGVVVGSAYGLTSMSRSDDADAFCDGPRCREPEGVRLRDEARDAGTVSTVAFAVGALGLAGGAWLWFTAPDGGGSTRVGLGPAGVKLRLRF